MSRDVADTVSLRGAEMLGAEGESDFTVGPAEPRKVNATWMLKGRPAPLLEKGQFKDNWRFFVRETADG